MGYRAGIDQIPTLPQELSGTPPTNTPPLADGPRIFNTSASGGLTTTASDLARLMIGFQRALAGDGSGPIPPAIAQAMMIRQPGETLPGQCIPTADPAQSACRSSWGLGVDVNLDRNFNHAADGDPTGAWFGHTGFNSGYLAVVLGSKAGGHGLAVLLNMAPEDMSGDAPQFGFLLDVVRRLADEYEWR